MCHLEILCLIGGALVDSLTYLNLLLWYVKEGKTDREIAQFCGVTRTAVVHARKKFKIATRKFLTQEGVSRVCKELLLRGYDVENKRMKDPLFIYDILVNNHIKLEVMTSSSPDQYGYFKFTLTSNPRKELIVSSTRIRLSTGRTLKLYSKTCDFLICVGFLSKEAFIWIIPSPAFPTSLQTLSLSPSETSKYYRYLYAWNLLLL